MPKTTNNMSQVNLNLIRLHLILNGMWIAISTWAQIINCAIYMRVHKTMMAKRFWWALVRCYIFANAMINVYKCGRCLLLMCWILARWSLTRSLTIKFLKQLLRMHSFRLLNHKHLSTPMASSLAVDAVNIYVYVCECQIKWNRNGNTYSHEWLNRVEIYDV